MSREPLVYNIIKQNLWKDCHNPIYEILQTDFDNIFLQKTINEEDVDHEFYIDTRLNENASNEKIIHHWKPIPENITSSEVFKRKIENNGLIYFLLGRKGIGKSSLLVHFIESIKTNTQVLPIYLDLKNQKSNIKFLSNLHNTIYPKIYNRIITKKLNHHNFLENLNLVKSLDYRFAHLSEEKISEMLINEQETVISSFLNKIKEEGINVYLIIDNIDDWPIKSVNSIIDVCHFFKNEFNIKSIIALRDYWTPKNLELSDYNYASFLLTKPDFINIINRRLDLLSPDLSKNEFTLHLYESGSIKIIRKELIDIFRELVKQIHEDKELQNTLFNLSNCNTREYIKYIFYFFHSIYLSSKSCFEHLISVKINEHLPEFEILPTRKIKLHDFIENNMAIHSLCYDTENSIIFNLFYHKYNYDYGEEYRSSLIFLRILQNISTYAPTEKNVIISNLLRLGYSKDATKDALKELLSKDLIESPEGAEMSKISKIFLSTKGNTYLKVVVYEYSYLLYLSDITPMPEKYLVNIKEKYGEEEIPIARGSLAKKNESVRNLISFLKAEQDEEEQNVSSSDFPILYRYRVDNFFNEIEQRIELTISKLLKGYPDRRKISDRIIQKITIK